MNTQCTTGRLDHDSPPGRNSHEAQHLQHEEHLRHDLHRHDLTLDDLNHALQAREPESLNDQCRSKPRTFIQGTEP